jgi:hypothetical protein
MQSRRNILRGSSALLAASLVLAACAGQTAQQLAQTAVSDAELVASAFSKELPTIQALTGIPTTTLTELENYVSEAASVGSAIVSGISVAQAGPIVSQIKTYIGEALAIATAPPVNALLPPGVLEVLEAANSLLPGLLAAVGLLAAAPVASKYAPGQARTILQAA